MAQGYSTNGNIIIEGQEVLYYNTPLNAGQSYTSDWIDVQAYPSVVIAVATDQNGTYQCQFSADGSNADGTLPTYTYSTSNVNPPHRFTVTRRYFRVIFNNTSASNQTYIRLQLLVGGQQSLTSNLNSTIARQADSLLVRPLDFNLMVGEGLYENRQNFIKDGFNNDIDTASVPEDITNEGGIYAGFPTGSPEAGEIVVSGADTGTVVYFYLATSDDLDYTFATKAITGAGNYSLGHNIWRCNFAYFISSSSTSFNVGDITIRNTPTTANVFCVIPAGYSQTFCSGYTVPASSAIYFDRITGSIRGTTTGSLDGFFWYREFNSSPRLRFPFELQYGGLYFDDVDYLIKVPAKTDIIPRILTSSANNLQAKISYRFIKVKE